MKFRKFTIDNYKSLSVSYGDIFPDSEDGNQYFYRRNEWSWKTAIMENYLLLIAEVR